MVMSARMPDAYQEFDLGTGSGNAFQFTQQTVAPTWNPGPSTVGSSLGVPPATNIAGMTPDGGAANKAYTAHVLSRPTYAHPILWAVILFMAGIILLGMVSHIEAKRR